MENTECPCNGDEYCSWCRDGIPNPGHPGGGHYPDDDGY